MSTTPLLPRSGTPPDGEPPASAPGADAAVALAVALAGSTLLQAVCAAHIASILPDIAASFPMAETTWVGSGFFLAAAVAAPLGGRMADLLGARRVAIGGLVMITLASVAAAAATGMPALVAARAMIGIGCAVQFPSALAIVRQARVQRAPMVLAAIALASELSFTAASSVSSLLSQIGGWRAVLVAPAVLAVAAMAVLLWRVPAQPAPWPGIRRLWTALDMPGIAVSSAAVIVLLVWLLALPITVRWSLLAVLAVLAGLTWMWERGFAPNPFLPVGLFAGPNLAITVVRHALFFTAFFGLYFALPAWLTGRGLSSLQVAAVLAILPVVAIITRLATPSIDRIGARWPLVVGSTSLAVAAGTAVLIGAHGPTAAMIVIVALLGVTGLVNHANQFVLYVSAPPEHTGTISGIYRAVQLLAGALMAVLSDMDTSPQAVPHLAVLTGIAAVLLLAASTTGTGPTAPRLRGASTSPEALS